MVSLGISEFTFGYAFLYEQTQANWGGIRAAPILPSLQQEHEEGWDARLPTNAIDFYYQFKLTDYLSRSNASFIADGTYSEPYYRISLHRKDCNWQHQRLRDHCQTNPHTYYVAPEFSSADDFNAAFLAQRMTEQSRIIPLADCDDIDDGDQHYITYQQGHPSWVQHSKPKRHQRSFHGRDLQKLYGESGKDWRRVDRQFASNLFDKTYGVVRSLVGKEEPRAIMKALPLLNFDPSTKSRREVLVRTSQILSVFLGVTLVLVGSSD